MKRLFSRKILFTLLLMLCIIPVISYFYFFRLSAPVTTLDENETGNISGNIANGGFTAFMGDWIYLSNFSDNNKLYKLKSDGSSLIKLSNNSSSWINVSGNWIFYYNNSKGSIYKMQTDGTKDRRLCSDKASYINLVGNEIYYSNESDNRIIYVINVNGRNKKRINDESSTFVNVLGDYIYYRNQAHNLVRINKDGSHKVILDNGVTDFINISENEIYYTLQEDRPRIYKMRIDGTDKEKVGDFEAYNLLIDEEWIYFTNSSYGGYIYRMKRSEDTAFNASLEVPMEINIAGNRIFYKSYQDKGKLYLCDLDGSKRRDIYGDTVVYTESELYDAIINNIKFTLGDRKLDETYKRAKDIVSNTIKPGMNQLQKEMALHDYLLKKTKYDTKTSEDNLISSDSHSAYSVLVKGIGVCDGYSEAMQMLLALSGIKSEVVEGNDEKTKDMIVGHAWNIVQIDGKYYQLDVTWDDYVQDNYGMMSYKYFNLPDNIMTKDHKWANTGYEKCTSGKYEFFYNMDSAQREGEWIFYSNEADKNKLYKIKMDGNQNKKISNDVAIFFGEKDGWIYYSNYSNGGYLYKIKTDGTGKTRLNRDWSINIKIDGEWINYQNKSDKDREYKIKIDGTERQKI